MIEVLSMSLIWCQRFLKRHGKVIVTLIVVATVLIGLIVGIGCR